MDRSTAPFEVGDKVVSLKHFESHKGMLAVPKKNQTLTVRTVEFDPDFGGFWVLRFFEIKNPRFDYHQGFIEGRFSAKWFRKINPYQSSVSRELAERAVESIGDGQDLKPVKEVVNS